MAEKFKLTENFTPNTEKRAIFRPTENFQFSDEIKKKWATADAESHAKKALSGIAENVSTELKSGIVNSKAIAKSKPFNAYVSGNPIPHINPQGGVIGTKKEAEEYAKKATAGDGFEGLSLDELKKRLDGEKEVYERTKGNAVTNALDFIGSDWFSKNGSFNKTEEYKNQYKALKNAYENRKAAYTDYAVSKKYGVGSAEEAIELLKKRQKETKSDTVKRNLDEEIKTIREGLYGKGSIVKANVKGLTDTGFKQFLSLQAKTMDATLGNVARAFGFKNNVFSQTNDYYRNLYEQSHREQERLAKGVGDKYNISGSLGEGVLAALPDAAASSVIAILTGGASVAPQLGKAATGIRAALQTSIKSMAKNPFYWSSFVQTYGSDFEDAKSNGANDAVASLYAVLNSSLNAAVEVGGGTGNAGIQSLPEALKNAVGNKSAVMEWVKSALDEGKEEVIQGVITQLNTGLFFDRNKAIYSNTDENAVFNPSRMLQEGAMGAAVGAVLGAGQMTISAISNASVSSEWRAIGETVKKSGIKADELAEFAAKSLDTETRALGINSLNSKSISAETIGKLYSYACRSIRTDILLPENINEVSENFNKIMDGTDSKSIQDIASACFVTKLMQLGTDEESAEYMASGGVTTAENTDLQPTVKESVFDEVSAQKAEYDLIEDWAYTSKGKTRLTDEQKKIAKIGKALGWDVKFDAVHIKDKNGKTVRGENGMPRRADGSIDIKNKRITIDYENKQPIQFIFKHELTHFGEGSKLYGDFAEAVEKSKLFEKWLGEKTGKQGSTVRLKAQLLNDIMSTRTNAGAAVDTSGARAEMIADFVGDALFSDNGSGLKGIIKNADTRERGAIRQFLHDFISYLKKKISGNREISFEISKLEDMFNRMFTDAAEKTSDNQTEKYSLAGERARTSNNSLLEIAKRRIENGEDGETVRQETGWFKGYDGKWRFEISDFESHLIENPKLERREADGEIYFTGKLSDILEHRELFKAYPELKNINIIIQPTDTGVQGVYQKKSNYITLDINLFKRHTKEYSDYLNGGRKTEIERIEQTPEYKEYSKYHDDPAFENLDPEIWLKEEKAAQKKFFDSELGKRYYELNWGKNGFTGQKIKLGWNNGAEAVLMHELQHAIQGIEEFAGGSSPKHWSLETKNAEAEYSKKQAEYEKRLDGFADVLYRYGYTDDDFEKNDITTESGIEEAKQFLKKAEAPNGAIELADNLKQYAKDRDEAFSYYWRLKKGNPSELYKATAGEIEARDVEKRLNYTVEQRKNTRPDIDRKDVVFADGSTGISLSQDISKYPYNMQTVIKEYISSADKSVEDFINAFNTNKRFARHKISNVTENQVADIKRLIGIDVSGYTNSINTNAIRHIEKRHGKNGIADSSMSNILDIARIGYVLENYDNVEIAKKGMDEVNSSEFRNAKNEPAPMIVFSKRINGTYYVAQAIPDSEYKKLWVVSAYINKKEAGTQALNPENKTPVGKSLVSSASNINVPQNGSDVNTNISENTQNDTEKYSIETESTDKTEDFDKIADLVNRYNNGEISKNEYYEQMREKWREAGEKYGTIPEGENAAEDYGVPNAAKDGAPTRRYVRTVLETGSLTDSMKDQIGAEILQGNFSYSPISDENAIKSADKAIESGEAEKRWKAAIESKNINKKNIAIGERLLADAIKVKDNARVLELSAELSDVLTRAGQVVQSARLLKQMTGVGRLVALQRTVQTLNADLAKRFGDKAPVIQIDKNVAQIMAESQTEEEIERAYRETVQDIADQVPATFLDKWNAWRYFAMLANPRTHIRNIVGNTIFIPAVRAKDVIATGIERIAQLGNSEVERTKVAAVKKKYREFAKNDANNKEVKALLRGQKYDERSQLYEMRRTFKNNALEFLTSFNGNLLEAEDLLFKNRHYIHALGSFLQARKADLNNVSESLMFEARSYAVKEAQKATFNDESAIANYLKSITRIKDKDTTALKVAKIAIDGVIPFKRTPVNIIRRGIEYSPIGLGKALTAGLYDVKKGKISISEFADGLAAGLTGTGIFAIGLLLSGLGYVNGGFGDDDEDKFKKLNGDQEYSVRVFGKSYTIDWAAPACIPFFIGVETANSFKDGDGVKLSDFTGALWNSLEPVTNLSMLSGIQNTISAAKYSSASETLASIGEDIALSYAMQGIPSILGSVSRTIDKKQRMWYTDKNSGISKFGQEIINNIQSKVPGLSFTQVPKIDEWGRIVTRGSLGERLAENFISPGYYSAVEYDDVNAELKRIYKETGEGAVLPGSAPKSFKVGDKQKYLTGGEYVTFATTRGQYAFDYVQEFTEMPAYKKMTDEQRVKVITGLYEYSNAKAKTTVSDYDLTANYKTVTNFERNGTSAVYYYISRALK